MIFNFTKSQPIVNQKLNLNTYIKMAKTKLSAYMAKRRVRKIVNGQEIFEGQYFLIHYNSDIPPKHRMLR